ncbi:MAG: efflux RND transporter periplasmic adaptor subunit [Myxococcales bacterium]|nr:efflux RND transporter periplasmic adaptor subunit [Myxococcales bacterium]
MSLALLGGLVLAILLLWACSGAPPEAERPEAAPLVRVEVARPVAHRYVVNAHGTVSPRTESDLVPQVSGEVVAVSPALAAGGFFSKGDVLARIERADYEAELESARAAVERASSEFGRASKERDRQRSLADRSVASQARIDDAENAYRVADASLREARARLARAERDLERTDLRAPYTGRVRSESVDVGQFVQRGAPIAKLYAVDWAEVRLPLPDRELAYVDLPLAPRSTPELDGTDPGSEAHGGGPSAPAHPVVRLHAEFAGAMRSWEGEVVRTEGELDPRSRMVHVVARVADPYGIARGDADATPLSVGLFVDAEILGREVRDVFVLPRTALRGESRMYVVDGDGALRIRDVDVLRIEGEQVVVGGGLAPGDRVCTSPLAAAVDGMAVRVQGEAPVAAAADGGAA